MLKLRRLGLLGGCALTAFACSRLEFSKAFVASNKHIHLDSRKPRLLSREEVKASFIEKHGENSGTYFDLAELPSLGEDATCHGNVGDFECWGIFDGHSGWCNSNYVANHILGYIQTAFDAKAKSKWLNSALTSQEIDEAVEEAFCTLDTDIIQAPLNALDKNDPQLAAAALPIALNGSCAMLSMYDSVKNVLKIALVGDSRAVLGTQDENGVWHAENLTVDQTGENEDEIKRIRSEHPNDPPEIVSRGRVLGYQPSRTFGDAVTKWSREAQKQLRSVFWVNGHHSLLRSPPYLTAKPVVTTKNLDPTKPSFLVMGCDGLYEWLTNKQVVDLVSQYLEKNKIIPIFPVAGIQDDSNDGSAKDFLRPKALNWGPLEPTVEDDNCATHLIRNALGGAEFQKVSLLISIPSPLSRRHRDDITCTVVFFKPK